MNTARSGFSTTVGTMFIIGIMVKNVNILSLSWSTKAKLSIGKVFQINFHLTVEMKPLMYTGHEIIYSFGIVTFFIVSLVNHEISRESAYQWLNFTKEYSVRQYDNIILKTFELKQFLKYILSLFLLLDQISCGWNASRIAHPLKVFDNHDHSIALYQVRSQRM